MRKTWRRIAIVGLTAAAISGVTMVGVGQATTTESKPAATAKAGDVSASGRKLMKCGNGNVGRNRCLQARRALAREGVPFGPLRHNVPGCTAPGCVPGWHFYYG
jgi:hypothetical protein